MKSKDDEIKKEELLTSYGIGKWRPKSLQFMAHPQIFFANLIIVGVIQTMGSPIYFSGLSTLEKRYRFDSKVSGFIILSDCIVEITIGPIIGYLALYYNRSRVLACGEVMLAIGFLVSALPYFIYGPLDLTTEIASSLANVTTGKISEIHEMCLATDEAFCTGANNAGTIWPAVAILFIGRFLLGGGFAFYFVIAYPYIDDNVSKRSSPIYLSTVAAVRIIGSGLGFVVSGFFLKFFENPFVDPGITQTDPRFVGAWWLGMVATATFLLIFTLPLFFYPSQFKTANADLSELKQNLKHSGGVWAAIGRFLTNPVVMLYTMGSIFRFIGTYGTFIFKSKYIESQYRVSSSKASLLMGTTSMIPMSVGIMLGGLWIWWKKPSPKTILIFTFLVEASSIISYGSGFFFGCDPISMDGQIGSDGSFQLDSSCNANCNCSTRVFTPVCAGGNLNYFSPCHAGCQTYLATNQTYQDCSCTSQPVTTGFCPEKNDQCGKNLIFYLSFLLVGHVIARAGSSANSLISFRSVKPMDKTFTVGVSNALLSIFAFLPTPLLYGAVVDSTCQVWESKCGKTGNCWHYDQDLFRWRYHSVTVVFLFLGSVLDFAMIFFYDRIENFYDDDVSQDEKEKRQINISNNNNFLETSEESDMCELQKII